MLPLLLDEGLPASVALALSTLGWDVKAVGMPDAPSKGSGDEINCAWCAERDAVLVTHDRGRKDKTILNALAEHHVHAVFVYAELRAGPAHNLARALLVAESAMDDLATRQRGLLQHRLKPTGKLEPRR